VDVAITTLRAELSSWIDRARSGEEIVVTERGIPVVRMLAIDSAPMIERLTREGVLGAPESLVRPIARAADRVVADGPVSDYISDNRR
jgi:prevent-host-death family protein